jgi:transcription elongation factor Elf1
MRKPSVKPTEHKCPACNGTGFPMVMQPVKPSSRIYPVQCKNCGGKGRIAATANLRRSFAACLSASAV